MPAVLVAADPFAGSLPAWSNDVVAGNYDQWLHSAGRPPRMLRLGTVVDVMTGGSHHPLLCQLEENDAPAGLWVVKPQHCVSISERRTTLGVLAELAAADVCAWIGLSTPATGLLMMPDTIEGEALPLEYRDELVETFAINRGTVAYCSRKLELAMDAEPDVLLKLAGRRPAIRAACSKLYALDAFIRHDDRTADRPNALIWQESLVAIDHGAAFVYLDRPGHTGESVARMTALTPGAWKRHVARPAIEGRGEANSLEDFEKSVQGVVDDYIAGIAERWPEQLDAPAQAGGPALRKEMVSFLRTRRDLVEEIVANTLLTLGAKR